MAPRSNWKGYLKLSLVSASIAIYPATSSSEKVRFNTLNRATGNRLKRKMVDAVTEVDVPTEEQVKSSGVEYRVGRFPFSANPRARCMDESEGLVKIIADAKSDRVLAVHIFGPRASDMIAEAVTVMEFGGSAEDIARISHAHPTLSEAVKEAALGVEKRAIHM